MLAVCNASVTGGGGGTGPAPHPAGETCLPGPHVSALEGGVPLPSATAPAGAPSNGRDGCGDQRLAHPPRGTSTRD